MKLFLNFDGTLRTNTSIPGKRLPTTNWEDYEGELMRGVPHKVTRALARILAARGIEVHILTTWPEPYRALIEQWLTRYKVPCTRLYMRPEGDTTVAAQLKLNWVQTADKGDIFMVIDNNPRVIRQYKRRGLPAFLSVLPQPGAYTI